VLPVLLGLVFWDEALKEKTNIFVANETKALRTLFR
jgi:hypothetical protein